MDNAYWTKLSSNHKSGKIEPVICKWEHFTIGPEDAYMCGFGGRKFKITYIDNSITYTTNLWHQGTIPENMHHLFENNVISVEPCD